jgi:hypothetical protein
VAAVAAADVENKKEGQTPLFFIFPLDFFLVT